MLTTRYFAEQVLCKRPYLSVELCVAAISNPLRREQQSDGCIRIWCKVTLPDQTSPRILRVVLLEEGRTIHNAFLDRSYR